MVKTFWKSALLFCIVSLLLAGTALADSGPKPQLVVKVLNGPEEPYYLDLLAEGGGGNGLSQEERNALDQDMLSALLAAVPEGWHACVTEGTGVPIWGELTSEDGVHTFGYVGVPETYRILVVTRSGETWVSETLERKVLQSSVALDWMAKTVEVPPVWAGYVLQFLATLLPTLLAEGILLLAFRFDWKTNWRPFLLVNLVTQGALAVFMSFHIVRDGFGWWFLILLVPAELVIALVEAGLYCKLLQGRSRARSFVYGLTANAISALLGWYLAEPVWRWIVTIC